MGKKSIPCELIKNSYQRTVCYRKRVKGLVKKAIELSIICDQDIEIVISDKTNAEVVVYRSSDDFNFVDCSKILKDSQMLLNPEKAYVNDDYDEIFNQDVKKYSSRTESKRKVDKLLAKK